MLEKLLAADSAEGAFLEAEATAAAGLESPSVRPSLSGVEFALGVRGAGASPGPESAAKEAKGQTDTMLHEALSSEQTGAVYTLKEQVAEASLRRVEAVAPETGDGCPHAGPLRPRGRSRHPGRWSGARSEDGTLGTGFSSRARLEAADTIRKTRRAKSSSERVTVGDEFQKASAALLASQNRGAEATICWGGISGDRPFSLDSSSPDSREDSFAPSEASGSDSSFDGGGYENSGDSDTSNLPQESFAGLKAVSVPSSTAGTEGFRATSLCPVQVDSAANGQRDENAGGTPLHSTHSEEERGIGGVASAAGNEPLLDKDKKQKGKRRRRSRRLLSRVALA